MPKLRVLSGREVVKNFIEVWFRDRVPEGKLRKAEKSFTSGTKQTLTVPLLHEELDKGTLKAIIRQASRYIPEEELKQYFYR